MPIESIRPGIYNVDYFSGSQVAIYIGDVWVDEITSISYSVSQARTPLYGYADMLWRDVSKGPVIVQGQFTVNFKEAGYLFVILNRYLEKIRGREALHRPFHAKSRVDQLNIEQLINGEMSTFQRNKYYQHMAKFAADARKNPSKAIDPEAGMPSRARNVTLETTQARLTGYSSKRRAQGGMKGAEGLFESFEDAVWRQPQGKLDSATRRADDPRLNPFDIYVSFGDFVAGSDYDNHTIQKISEVNIVGTSKQIVIDGQPIQEAYSFIARNLV